jgi:uncharacterized phage-associated protein
MTHACSAIANEFLKRAQAEGRPLTHMHLQKLVYIAHGWHLAVNNEPLVDEQFQAWEFGPVSLSMYRALKGYGSGPITRLIRQGDDTPGRPEDDGDSVTAKLELSEREIIDQIWQEFREYKAFQLSALTHKPDSPWDNAFKRGGQNTLIPNNDIQDYFAVLADAS